MIKECYTIQAGPEWRRSLKKFEEENLERPFGDIYYSMDEAENALKSWYKRIEPNKEGPKYPYAKIIKLIVSEDL